MDQHFYGLTQDGQIVTLPKHEYSSGALNALREEHEKSGTPMPELQMIFGEQVYRVIYSHMEVELDDIDGDGQVPHYMCVSFATQLPIFPHPSVDTEEGLEAFRSAHPVPLTNGIVLSEAKSAWPAPKWEPQPTSEVTP